MKLPALQFYPGDWRKDPGVQALSRHDRSVWFDMLLIMHESDERGVLLLAGKPMPIDALARMLYLDNQEVNQIIGTLLTYGVASKRDDDGAIYSRRMVRDEQLLQIRRNAGRMGGNPLLLNQMVNQNPTTGVNQKSTPSSSSSSSKKLERPTIEEVCQFCESIELPRKDGEATFWKWEANEWINGKRPIKDWKATIRQWKASNFMPSQKNNETATGTRPTTEAFKNAQPSGTRGLFD